MTQTPGWEAGDPASSRPAVLLQGWALQAPRDGPRRSWLVSAGKGGLLPRSWGGVTGRCAGSRPAPTGAPATWWGCPGGHFPRLPGPLSSNSWDVPGGSVADTPCSQCRGPGSVSGQGRPSPAKQGGSGRSYMIYKTLKQQHLCRCAVPSSWGWARTGGWAKVGAAPEAELRTTS